MILYVSILFCFIFVDCTLGTIHNVNPGEPEDFITKLEIAADYDTILLPPGDYFFERAVTNDLGDDSYENIGDLCNYLPQSSDHPNLLIRGTGSDRSDTKLVSARFDGCGRFMVVENLSLYNIDPYTLGSVAQDDNEGGVIFRDVHVRVHNNFKEQEYTRVYAFFIMICRIGILYSKIEISPPVPGVGNNVGLRDEGYGVVVMESEFEGFNAAILTPKSGARKRRVATKSTKVSKAERSRKLKSNDCDETCITNRNYKYSKNEFTRNNIDYAVSTELLEALSLNTPVSTSPSTIRNFIDILRFRQYFGYDGPYIICKIKFKKVTVAGETSIYQVPSAYPEPPDGVISAQEPQYYQIDSTAEYKGELTVYFDKATIDSKFVSSPNIVVKFHNGNSWKSVKLVEQGQWYKFKVSKKKLESVIAFFDDSDDGT